MTKEPIFARTRHYYGSYFDFWNLVEISGFKVCYIDQIDLESDEIFIVGTLNGELKQHMDHRRSILKGPQKARVILWNLERPGPDAMVAFINEYLPYFNKVWFSDKFLAEYDSKNFVYTELGSHPNLPHPGGPQPPVYDFAHLSYIVPRRQVVFDGLVRMGYRMSQTPIPAERGAELWKCRSMVNVHQNEFKICEPIRFAISAAYKLPIITEEIYNPYPLEHGKTCLISSYEKILENADKWLSSDITSIGHDLHKRLAIDFSFRQGVMEALAKSI